MKPIAFTLNGVARTVTVDEDRTLLWVLRDDLGFTGTKFGCGASFCGACTVLIDGTGDSLLRHADQPRGGQEGGHGRGTGAG